MKKKNIKNQLHNSLREKIAFGESKHNDKQLLKGFGQSTYKIYSYNTYNTYLKVSGEYAKWLVEEKQINKYTKIEDTEQLAKEYIQYRLNNNISVYTAKMERSALGMIYNKPIEIKMPKRENKAITRSRNITKNDKHHSRDGKYKDFFTIAIGSGGRRSDLQNLTIKDFVEKDNQLYIKFVQSKGGRDRLTPVLQDKQNDIKKILEDAKTLGKIKLFDKIPTKIDVHSLRREYAQNLYKSVSENEELRNKYLKEYPNRREKVKRDFYKDRDNNIYNRDSVYIVTQALGHNRLEVAVTHYLKQ